MDNIPHLRVIIDHRKSLTITHIIIFLLQTVNQKMNSLKIPDLNLFRGKRTTRLTQYDTLQQEGIKQLEKNNKKDFLKDIKT